MPVPYRAIGGLIGEIEIIKKKDKKTTALIASVQNMNYNTGNCEERKSNEKNLSSCREYSELLLQGTFEDAIS